MTEADLQEAVVDLAMLLGFRVMHTRPARVVGGWRTPLSGHKGFVDLVLAKNGRVICVELKSEKGRLTEDQLLWQHAIAGGPTPYRLWRPRDWLDGTIERELKEWAR